MLFFELDNEQNDEYLVALKKKYQYLTIALMSVCTVIFILICCL